MKTIYILLSINFCVNCFLAGGFFEEQKGGSRREMIWLYVVTVFLIFFGWEGFIVQILIELCKRLLRSLARITQIPFYYSFYLTSKYNTLDFEQFKNIDRIYEHYKDKKTLVGRHIAHTIKLVYKKHNHIFKTKKEYDDEYQKWRLEKFNSSQQGLYPIGRTLQIHSCGAVIPFHREKWQVNCNWCGESFELTYCQSSTDGECFYDKCPQLRDNEPHKTGRSCPLYNREDDRD